MVSLGPFSRFLGPRYMELARLWAPTAAGFGGVVAAGTLYLTDWKLVVRYIPYYGSKFQEEED